MAKTSRFEFRVHPDVKARIEAAAEIVHESASDFARTAALARADEILRRQEVTMVPAEFFDQLMASLDEPPEPNERLTRAARGLRDVVDIR